MELTHKAEYHAFLGEGEDGRGRWARYRLSGVLVRERFSSDPELTETGESTLYFFPGRSVCVDEAGEDAPLPRSKPGDLMKLSLPDGTCRTLRVREAAFYDGGSLGLSHVRLRGN